MQFGSRMWIRDSHVYSCFKYQRIDPDALICRRHFNNYDAFRWDVGIYGNPSSANYKRLEIAKSARNYGCKPWYL